jgi:transposase
MIEEKGCKLEFLPRYSPDFNPIEQSFSVINSALETAHQLNESEDFDTLEKKFKEAIKGIDPWIVKGWFWASRVPS